MNNYTDLNLLYFNFKLMFFFVVVVVGVTDWPQVMFIDWSAVVVQGSTELLRLHSVPHPKKRLAVFLRLDNSLSSIFHQEAGGSGGRWEKHLAKAMISFFQMFRTLLPVLVGSFAGVRRKREKKEEQQQQNKALLCVL